MCLFQVRHFSRTLFRDRYIDIYIYASSKEILFLHQNLISWEQTFKHLLTYSLQFQSLLQLLTQSTLPVFLTTHWSVHRIVQQFTHKLILHLNYKTERNVPGSWITSIHVTLVIHMRFHRLPTDDWHRASDSKTNHEGKMTENFFTLPQFSLFNIEVFHIGKFWVGKSLNTDMKFTLFISNTYFYVFIFMGI